MEGEIAGITQDNYCTTSSPIAANQFQHDARFGGTGPRIRPVPKLKYRWSWFKKVGAAITLYNGFVVFVAFHHVWNTIGRGQNCMREYAFLAGVLFPFAGWLADVYVSRYKLIRSSIFVMWISSLLLPIVYHPSILQTSYAIYSRAILLFLLGLGTCCCQVNLIQFGIDQLKDSSSREITSYIKWYVWTYFASMVVVEFTQICTCPTHIWMSILYIPVLFSIALCIDFIFNHLLVREHVTQNPLPLIFGVLKYAAKNRYPQLRSSYVYWNNKCCSRINLAKNMFGGPFTAQQVEDVKSFFQISILTLLGGIFLSVFTVYDWLIIQPHETALCDKIISTPCLMKSLCFKGGYVIVTLFIPVSECVILPFIQSCLPYFKIFVRMALGGVICLLYAALISTFVVLKKLDMNVSFRHCSHLNKEDKPLYWFIFLSVINCTGLYTIMATGIEFICAQCPLYMKGFIIGLFYFFYSASYVSVLKIDEYCYNCHTNLCPVATNMIVVVAIAGIYGSLVGLYKTRRRYYDTHERLITDVIM